MDRHEMCQVLNTMANSIDFETGEEITGLSDKSVAAIYKALFELGCNSNDANLSGSNAVIAAEKIVLNAKDKILLDALTEYRTEVSKELGYKAYWVGTNRALHEMAYYKPISMAELMEIHGVGEKIADEFGDEYLAIINDFISGNDLEVEDDNKE
ncbi:HRDC domain-containing protein [Candidatus Thioglobus sp.]|uniref:HRDC domain-containing protein n=1 Tax=Candidatus Thioglobus sp. TaxID=2026721 RepID=UPI003242FA2E